VTLRHNGAVDPASGVHLLRGDDRADDVDALAERLGGRVGLPAVLDDLDRTAPVVRVPARAAHYGFRWDADDVRSARWWPQGVTTSSDAVSGSGEDLLGGRPVVVASAYSHAVGGVSHGSRISVVDLSTHRRPRYRHVLLVEAFRRHDGRVDMRPVRVHAGGIVWHGGHLHVAGTTRGLSTFRLADVLRVPAGDASRIGVRDSPAAVDAFGHRYVLPLRFSYAARTPPGQSGLRYSFASLDRSASPHELVTGEYSLSSPTRLARYPIDPGTSLLREDGQGRSLPAWLSDGGIPHMQGAASVDGTWFVTVSRGRYRQGSLWVGRPGRLRELRHQLPVGPEDITYWPERDELWSLSEYPRARYVFAMPRGRLLDEA
jgi:hypothetical protein